MSIPRVVDNPEFQGQILDSIAPKQYQQILAFLKLREKSRKDYTAKIKAVCSSNTQEIGQPLVRFTCSESSEKVKLTLSRLAIAQWLGSSNPPMKLDFWESLPENFVQVDLKGNLSSNKIDLAHQLLSLPSQTRPKAQRIFRVDPLPRKAEIDQTKGIVFNDWTGIEDSSEMTPPEYCCAVISPSYPRWFSEFEFVQAMEEVMGEFGDFQPKFPTFSSKGTLFIAWVAQKGQYQAEMQTGDVIAGGFYFSNNAWGRGAFKIGTFFWRLVCTNGMVSEQRYSGVFIRHTGNFDKNLHALLLPKTIQRRRQIVPCNDFEATLPKPPSLEECMVDKPMFYRLIARVAINRILSEFSAAKDQYRTALKRIVEDWQQEISAQARRFRLSDQQEIRLRQLIVEDEMFNEHQASTYDIANTFTRLGNYSDISAEQRFELWEVGDQIMRSKPLSAGEVE